MSTKQTTVVNAVYVTHAAQTSGMMKKVYIASLIACTLVYSASAFEWHTCAEGKADVSHVALSPDPPQAGDTISFSIDAESSKLACTNMRNAVLTTGVP